MQGFSHSGWAEWDLRLHLNEALTILPFTGWGGRQLSTSGFTGSFSPFLERLRSFAICKEEKLVSMWIHLEAVWTSMPRTNSETEKEFSYIMTSILVEIIGRDHCSPTAGHCFCGSLRSSSTEQCIIWPLPGLLWDFSLTHTHDAEKEQRPPVTLLELDCSQVTCENMAICEGRCTSKSMQGSLIEKAGLQKFIFCSVRQRNLCQLDY